MLKARLCAGFHQVFPLFGMIDEHLEVCISSVIIPCSIPALREKDT